MLPNTPPSPVDIAGQLTQLTGIPHVVDGAGQVISVPEPPSPIDVARQLSAQTGVQHVVTSDGQVIPTPTPQAFAAPDPEPTPPPSPMDIARQLTEQTGHPHVVDGAGNVIPMPVVAPPAPQPAPAPAWVDQAPVNPNTWGIGVGTVPTAAVAAKVAGPFDHLTNDAQPVLLPDGRMLDAGHRKAAGEKLLRQGMPQEMAAGVVEAAQLLDIATILDTPEAPPAPAFDWRGIRMDANSR